MGRKPNFIIMKKILSLILLVMMMNACNKDSFDEKKWNSDITDGSESDVNMMQYECTDSVFIVIGNAIGTFVDDIVEGGIENLESNYLLIQSLNVNLSFEEYIDTTTIIFGIDRLSVSNYLYTILEYKDIIIDPNNKEAIIEALYCYANNNGLVAEDRWIFSTLASLLGAPDCGFWDHAALIADAAGSSAVAILTANPFAGVGAVSNIINMYEGVIDCM